MCPRRAAPIDWSSYSLADTEQVLTLEREKAGHLALIRMLEEKSAELRASWFQRPSTLFEDSAQRTRAR